MFRFHATIFHALPKAGITNMTNMSPDFPHIKYKIIYLF